MLYRRTRLSTLVAAVFALACADQYPTGPSLTSVESETPVAATKRPRASLTGDIDQTIAGNVIDATVRITRLSQGVDGGLLASGVISGTANGTSFTQSFSNVPMTLEGGGGSATAAAAGGPTIQQEVGACDILLLDLGPLHLDVLGLVVDLSQVVLDIDAQAGAGNLVGNLLCAVVHLLDGPALFAAIANLLDQINAILGAVG
jgi:hypothetical protein